MIDEEQLRAEAMEATSFLREDPDEAKVREQLRAAGHEPSRIILGGFYEAETFETCFGFVCVDDLSLWYCETDDDDTIVVLERRNAVREFDDDFRAMPQALALANHARPRLDGPVGGSADDPLVG